MARGHGRILASIWEDEDFINLEEAEQRLYLFFISQPNLNHAGLLDLTLRRWARKARGLTVAELEKRIATLEEARFVVVDDDTEELLIRSFVRNDGVWRMPRVMGAMVSGAMEISSKRLQRALLEEMDRIPLEELSDAPAKLRNGTEGPSIRQQVADHIEALRRAFGNLTPDPSGRGSTTPSGTPSETPSDTPAEGGPRPSTRGRAGASHARTPAPAPTPAPNPSPKREGAGAVEQAPAAGAEAQRPDGRPSPHEIPDDFELTEGMRRWAQQTFPRVDVDHETQKFIWHWQSEGRRKPNWYAAWQKWIADANQYLIKHGAPGNVIQLPTGQTLTGTDATVAGWLALASGEENQ
ncbi:hypothetical protein [Streptomyces sp. DH37]|uniref:hypothetical protein n=1 Tax=Streptomyces sp. DH37 TaxID=3040122 RepID=UPI002441EF0B|nr:hypothetical protein [Streptomyces sp. DH37]MDG9701712.1 hypothetical protein [Streptomyces sp. DH37]